MTGGIQNLLIDGNNLLYRIFWTNNFKLEESESSTQIYLFLRSLKSYADKFKPKAIYCVWDKKLDWPSTNFRKEAIEVEYKENRNKENFQDVFEYCEKIMEIISLLGVKNIYPKRMEADDVLAWLSHNLTGKTVIVTTDKDLLQTVSKTTEVFNPIKKNIVTLENFEETVGVSKEVYLSYRAVTGDKSDNIPGVPRYGIKKFLKLKHQDNNNKLLVEESQLNEEQYSIYLRNWELMDLSRGYAYYNDEVPAYQKQVKDLEAVKCNFTKFIQEVKQFNFWSVVHNYSSWRETFDTNENILNIINKAIKNVTHTTTT